MAESTPRDTDCSAPGVQDLLGSPPLSSGAPRLAPRLHELLTLKPPGQQACLPPVYALPCGVCCLAFNPSSLLRSPKPPHPRQQTCFCSPTREAPPARPRTPHPLCCLGPQRLSRASASDASDPLPAHTQPVCGPRSATFLTYRLGAAPTLPRASVPPETTQGPFRTDTSRTCVLPGGSPRPLPAAPHPWVLG